MTFIEKPMIEPEMNSGWVIKECHNGHRCPYIAGIDVFSLQKDWEYLKAQVLDLETRLAQQEKENQNLVQEKEALQYQLKQALAKIFKPRVKPKSIADQPKRGAPVGHPGRGRKRPSVISDYFDVYPQGCDKCGGEIQVYEKTFDEHIVEDIEVRKKTTCYRFHYGYCPRCQKIVYLKGKDKASIMPYDRIGPLARAVGGYLRYLGLPYRKVKKVFKDVFDFKITHPSLLVFNTEQARNGLGLYEEIKEKIRDSRYVQGDETGWRVRGENWWLWVFTNELATLYQIDKSRGSKVVRDVLGKKYQGVLGSDFYSAYNKLTALARQRCIGHLLDELKKIQGKNKFTPDSIEGIFCQQLKEVLKQTIEIWNDYHKGVKTLEDLRQEKELAILKIIELLLLPSEHKDIRRIRKRIIKHNQELFTFLDNPLIEPTNNRAEPQLRPNVIMRKITFGNRSELGAGDHAIIMSIVQTGISNGSEPLDIFKALSVKPLTSYAELPRPP